MILVDSNYCSGKLCFVGGAVVNFGFTDTRIRGNQGYTFISKGTNSGSATGGSSGGAGGTSSSSNWSQVETV